MCGGKKSTAVNGPNRRTNPKQQGSQSSPPSTSGAKTSTDHKQQVSQPSIYEFSEISTATGNFKNPFSSSSSSSSYWRCSLRGKDAIVFQWNCGRPIESSELQNRLSSICKSQHSSIIKLLGACVSGNDIYLAYEFVPGTNLSDCLRNPSSTAILSTWLSRMQIAMDLADGLDYIHNFHNFVHNHIKSSSIVVSDYSKKGMICHFGMSELCGEIEMDTEATDSENSREGANRRKNLKRSPALTVEARRAYMAPELRTIRIPTQKCDVYAFGVVILELFSGDEPLKYVLEEGNRRVSVIETARAAVEAGELRKWMDTRLKDSYQFGVAEKMIRLGLDCVEEHPNKRPDMGRVSALVSALFAESKKWAQKHI